MADEGQMRISWHSYVRRNETKIALCEAMGEEVPVTAIGLWITPVREMVNCSKCLEWMHA